MFDENNLDKIKKSDISVTFIHHVFRETLNCPWIADDMHFLMHKFIYVIEGNYVLGINGRKLVLNQGEGLFAPKGTYYTAHSLSDNFDYIEVEFLTEKDPFLTFEFMDIYHFSNPRQIENLMLFMLNCWHGAEIGKELILKGKMYELFIILMNENLNNSSSKEYDKIKYSLDYIDKNYFKGPIGIEILAGICDMSISQYNRIFKRLFSTTPVKYMNSLRIDKAKAIIAQTKYPMFAISQMCGFSDCYYFSKTFKKHTGVTPIEYRNKHCE